MTINHLYNITINVMDKLEHIDFYDLKKKNTNQRNINEAYQILNNFKDELIREDIKIKQKYKQRKGD